MNRRMIASILGKILMAEAVLMLPSVLVGIIYKEAEVMSFLPAIVILALAGLGLGLVKPKSTAIYSRDGFFVVALAWILMMIGGAVPFYFCGHFETVADCIFEITSGFTTTGASILKDVEALPRCIIFWRSFTHWIGGMGVLVFLLAIMPLSEQRSLHLMRAEVPGPIVGKLVPKMKNTAKILYIVYAVMTVILTVMLICGGMPVFDSICNAFATAGTGGFSITNGGIADYNSAYIEIVLAVFMLLFGINFNLYYLIIIGKVREVLKSEELRVYIGIVTVSTVGIALSLVNKVGSFAHSLRLSFFQVSSIITTTGFSTADFTFWPQIAQHILVILMITGACAGSTGGGLKISRVLLLLKVMAQEIKKLLHPRAVTTVRLEGKPVEKSVIHGTVTYFAMYIFIICISTLLLSFDGFDLTTNITAELSCFNNIGPGLGAVGPMSNFSAYSSFSKFLLSFNMLLGRLEILPMLVLFTPSSWKNRI